MNPQQQTGLEYVTRNEYEMFTKMYEVRHAELRMQVKDLEIDNKAQFNALLGEMKALTAKVSSAGNGVWQMIAGCCLSGVAGYIAYYLQHLIVH